MATFIHSKLSVFKLDTAGGVLTDISQYVNEVGFPQELAEVETTCFGATARTYIPGFADATISLSGNWDRTFHTQMGAVYAAFKAGTISSVTFECGPEGSDSGDVKLTGEAVLISYEKNSSIDDPVTWSAELHVSGTVTDTTY